MPYVVIYDITRDSLRNKVANKLKDYGLNRIQYSAFVGDLRARNLRSLVIDLKKLLGKVGKEMEGERRKEGKDILDLIQKSGARLHQQTLSSTFFVH